LETVQNSISLYLFTSRKFQTGFRLVPKLVMLNGVMAVTFRYYVNALASKGNYVKLVDSSPIVLVTEV